MEREAIKEHLYNKYIRPTKKDRPLYIGIEIEMPVVNLSGTAADYAIAQAAADAARKKFGFLEEKRDENGICFSATRPDNGDNLSFDCSYNNLEISFGREQDLNLLEDRFRTYVSFLNEELLRSGHTLTGMGVNPGQAVNRSDFIPSERYRMLERYLQKSRIWKVPMYFHPYPGFGAFASASQVQLDAYEDSLISTIYAQSLLEPVKAVLFSNSLLASEPDLLCVRDLFWENSTHGINPHNIGMFESRLYSVDDLLEYICTTSIFCTERDGRYDRQIQERLRGLPEPELLWPFSNPPAIRNEDDIPVALFTGSQSDKTVYRNYLSDRYGRYKMTFSGIHFNFSFSEDLLRLDFARSGEKNYRSYKDRLYLELAEKMVVYGWIITAVMAASPLIDGSFVEKHTCGTDSFLGMASIRCSELGYWNYFTPVLSYDSLESYTAGIRRYVEDRIILFPSELYYPIRLKPPGANDLSRLSQFGISHIELRMIDLNPLSDTWVDERDLFFCQLLLAWLASLPRIPLSERSQILAAQNFKNAARYDLRTVRVIMPDGQSLTAVDGALKILALMEDFYRDFSDDVRGTLAFQKAKFLDAENRWARQVRRLYGNTFAQKGLSLAKERQDRILSLK